jgi:aspartate aminotransferase
MAIADKVKKAMISGSQIRKMFEEGIALKKVHGADKVFDLSIGSPVLEPPDAFDKELISLLKSPHPGIHRYMENAGYFDTRAAVAEHLFKETGIKFSANDIVMTCGAAGAINIAFKAILNPGDEVIAFAPFFFEYESYADNHGGLCIVIPSDDSFTPDFTALESCITPRTKALVINSPNNPTGIVYSEKVLQQLADIVTRKSNQLKTQIYIISDDVYSRLYYDGSKCPRMVNFYPHTIMVTSYSKELSLPGERIGYAAVHPDCEEAREVASGLIYANRVLGFINAPALMQNVVRNLQDVSVSVDEYRRKRDLLYDNLTQMGYSMIKPQGAFYILPRSPIPDDIAFVNELKKLLILTTPGSAFKAPGYFRVAYCLDDKTLKGSLDGFRKAIAKYQK